MQAAVALHLKLRGAASVKCSQAAAHGGPTLHPLRDTSHDQSRQTLTTPSSSAPAPAALPPPIGSRRRDCAVACRKRRAPCRATPARSTSRRSCTSGAFKSKEAWRDGAGRRFAPEEYFNVGGKTKWYGAALLRYGRHEFEADRAHQCLAWPFGYDELAPYYDEAEKLLGVRTFDTEPDLARILARIADAARRDWRSEPMPMGLHPTIRDHRARSEPLRRIRVGRGSQGRRRNGVSARS